MTLSVSNLSVSFPNQEKAVNKISFRIKKGQITAIVGESGSGKSVSALSILNLLPKSASISGEIIFEGQDILKLSEKSLCKIRGKDIGIIFQDPLTSLNPLHNIKKQISEAISVHNNYSNKKIDARVKELLKLVDLEDLHDRLSSYPHELSGGQKQRVMIAIAIANNPKFLIADEPTTALDISTQNEILKLLVSLKDKLGISILFITHNLRIARELADNILVMKQGNIVDEGKVDDIFNKSKNPYTKLLTSFMSSDFNSYQPTSSSNLLKVIDLNIKFPTQKNFFGLTTKYAYANKDISFNVKKAETLGIIGQSGSGKSTLALAITSLIKSQGEIIFNNENVGNFSKEQKNQSRRKIQIIFQDPFNSLNPRINIRNIVGEGLLIHKIGKADQRELMVDDILVKVGLDPKIKTLYPHQFSGGQRQRIAIARALILKPQLLILDEPTSALDVVTQNDIINLLKKLQQEDGISYIFISHDLDVVKSIAHRVMIIKNGEAVECGNVKDILENPQNKYTKELVELF